MKKNLLMIAVMAILSIAAAVAQPRAVGAQLGYGIEFSYEHSLGNNFLSVDAGFPGLFTNHTIGVEGVVTYNWLNPFGADFPSVSKGDWNWYMGVGAGLGAYMEHLYVADGHYAGWHNHFFLGAAGRIGFEYNFWFPLQLSLEWRPVLGPTFCSYSSNDGNHTYQNDKVTFNDKGLYVGGLALGVRYKF